MNKFFKAGLLLLSLFFVRACVYAAGAGKVQLAVAAPDPVMAGEDVTYQVIVVNVGTEKWTANDYYFEVEVYDSQKNYVTKTNPMKEVVTIDPGMSKLMYIPFSVPGNFSGVYFYRIFMVFKEQRLIESNYYSFNVTPLPVIERKKPKLQLGGNAILSYRQTSKYAWKDYTGNFNLNLVGQFMDKAMLFNLYTFHTPKSTSSAEGINNEIYTILFNYYGNNWDIGLGDILPSFSPLSIYGTGMRGGQFEGKSGIFSAGLVGARTAKSQEGTNETNGTFERWLLGARGGVELPYKIVANCSYVSSYDKESSITTPGPTLTPADDSVSGGSIMWTNGENVTLSVEYQTSRYSPDLRKSTYTLSDYAYRFEAKINPRNFFLRTVYQETRPNFYAFGSPGATKDRQSVDFYSSYQVLNRLSLCGGINRFKDNLSNAPGTVTTIQSIYNCSVSYSSPGKWPSPSLSYSINEAIGDPSSAQDNSTNSLGLGLTGKISVVNLGFSLQQSGFRDRNKISDDIDSITIGATSSSSIGTKLNMNLGLTLTSSKNLNKNINNQTPSYSFSVNYGILPGKLTSQLWGTVLQRYNDAVTQTDKIDVKETSGNIELTWLFRQDLTLTLGGLYTQTADSIIESNNLVNRGFNTRLSYSF